MNENSPLKITRPSLRKILRPESAMPEIIAGVLAVTVIILSVIVFWPSDMREGMSATQNAPAYRAPATPTAPTLPPK